MTQVAKATSARDRSWRRRLAGWEPAVAAAFLAWVARLHNAIAEAEVAQAILTGNPTLLLQVLQTVTPYAPAVAPVAEREAADAATDLERQLKTRLRLSLNLRDPNFALAAQRHEAQLVREVTQQTRRAITNTIVRAHRLGVHPHVVAPEIRETVGLTARQAQAVISFAEAQRKAGAAPHVAADRAIRYARRMRTRRAKTIARTETTRAATFGRLASYNQAADAGLFDTSTAELEWSSVQEDPDEVCAELDGQRVPFGEDFDGMLPPVHPNCRCSVFLVLE